MPHGEVCVVLGARGVHVACVALSACVFGGYVARVACGGGAIVAFCLVAVPIGQVVHNSCGVHGNCASCVVRDTCVAHVTVDISKRELIWGARSVFVA